MLAVRWLLAKDLRILRRSPALSALLIIYPAVVAVLIGLALSRAPRPAARRVPQPDPVQRDGDHARQDADRHPPLRAPALPGDRPGPGLEPRAGAGRRAQRLDDRGADHPADLPRRLASGDQSAYVQVIYNGDAVNQSLVRDGDRVQAGEGQRGTGGAARAASPAGRSTCCSRAASSTSSALSFNVLGLRASEQILAPGAGRAAARTRRCARGCSRSPPSPRSPSRTSPARRR